MKTKELLEFITDLFDEDKRTRRNKKKNLKKVLRKLRHKQRDLKQKIGSESDSQARKKLSKKLSVIKAQRKKGLSLLKEMKND